MIEDKKTSVQFYASMIAIGINTIIAPVLYGLWTRLEDLQAQQSRQMATLAVLSNEISKGDRYTRNEADVRNVYVDRELGRLDERIRTLESK